jgi:hypothetical protein
MTLKARLNKLEQAAAAEAAADDAPFCKTVTTYPLNHAAVRRALRGLGYSADDLQQTGTAIAHWLAGRLIVTRDHQFDEWETEWHARFFHHLQQQLRQQTGDPRRLIDVEKVRDALDNAFDTFDKWRAAGCPHDPLPPEFADPLFHMALELCGHAMDREEEAAT